MKPRANKIKPRSATGPIQMIPHFHDPKHLTARQALQRLVADMRQKRSASSPRRGGE